ncbi:MAG TPA: hypothetical protein VES61_01850 [Gaiellaceae bacterium]|nr:hypothetical protein [Gaiellaceae bacterium]
MASRGSERVETAAYAGRGPVLLEAYASTGLVLVLVLALVGAVLAGGVLLQGAGGHVSAASAPSSPAGLGHAYATSFGIVSVERAAKLKGAPGVAADASRHTASDIALQVEIQVTAMNRLTRPVIYSPGQFRLRLGPGGQTIAAVKSGRPGSLAPGEHTRARLRFMVPDGSSGRLAVQFDDIGRSRPIEIDLGRLGALPTVKHASGDAAGSHAG